MSDFAARHPGRASVPMPKRFWPKVDKSQECWLWRGAVGTDGYGRLGGSIKGKETRHAAHRVSWEMHNGPIPAGLLVCHHCDTPLCVNPAHLYLGTPRENMRDYLDRGRYR